MLFVMSRFVVMLQGSGLLIDPATREQLGLGSTARTLGFLRRVSLTPPISIGPSPLQLRTLWRNYDPDLCSMEWLSTHSGCRR
jgi:hypothetical protein